MVFFGASSLPLSSSVSRFSLGERAEDRFAALVEFGQLLLAVADGGVGPSSRLR